jgi:hypothetical protein
MCQEKAQILPGGLRAQDMEQVEAVEVNYMRLDRMEHPDY